MTLSRDQLNKAQIAHKLAVEEALSEEDDKALKELGYTSNRGWGCDCPGGDAIAVVIQHHSSGADVALWNWAVPLPPYES